MLRNLPLELNGLQAKIEHLKKTILTVLYIRIGEGSSTRKISIVKKNIISVLADASIISFKGWLAVIGKTNKKEMRWINFF